MKENQLKVYSNTKGNIYFYLLLAFTALFLISCSTANKVIYIAAYKQPCTGVGNMECMMIKKDKNQKDWEYFYSSIDGFTYEKGFEYKLLIQEEKIENPPADGSSIRYKLIKVIGKKFNNEAIK
ncbi:MAG: DUF4377 domain-containing protein [Chitinophagales bacterium]|nr:DUF4377 domain-containing protein [Chitinophagales bacterium]